MNFFQLTKDWSHSSSKDFWGEIASGEHVVQVYDNDKILLDLLHGFASQGLDAGEGVIIIATPLHLELLGKKLTASGFNVQALEAGNVYIPLNAELTLSRFMINGKPDEDLFSKVVSDLLARAHAGRKHLRAFGEMVAILSEKGEFEAAIWLENMWNKFCTGESFSLFCAYPRSSLTQTSEISVMHICNAHSKMIAGVTHSQTEVFYKTIEKQA